MWPDKETTFQQTSKLSSTGILSLGFLCAHLQSMHVVQCCPQMEGASLPMISLPGGSSHGQKVSIQAALNAIALPPLCHCLGCGSASESSSLFAMSKYPGCCEVSRIQVHIHVQCSMSRGARMSGDPMRTVELPIAAPSVYICRQLTSSQLHSALDSGHRPR